MVVSLGDKYFGENVMEDHLNTLIWTLFILWVLSEEITLLVIAILFEIYRIIY